MKLLWHKTYAQIMYMISLVCLLFFCFDDTYTQIDQLGIGWQAGGLYIII